MLIIGTPKENSRYACFVVGRNIMSKLTIFTIGIHVNQVCGE